MTKKSEARVLRDQAATALAAQGVHSPYVDLQNMYNSQRELFPAYYSMATIVSNPQISKHLTNIGATTNLIRGLSADVNDLWVKLNTLHAKHAGLTTMPDLIDEDENLAIIMMYQEYSMYMQAHQQTILPLMLELDEHLAEALKNKTLAEALAIPAPETVQ